MREKAPHLARALFAPFPTHFRHQSKSRWRPSLRSSSPPGASASPDRLSVRASGGATRRRIDPISQGARTITRATCRARAIVRRRRPTRVDDHPRPHSIPCSPRSPAPSAPAASPPRLLRRVGRAVAPRSVWCLGTPPPPTSTAPSPATTASIPLTSVRVYSRGTRPNDESRARDIPSRGWIFRGVHHRTMLSLGSRLNAAPPLRAADTFTHLLRTLADDALSSTFSSFCRRRPREPQVVRSG